MCFLPCIRGKNRLCIFVYCVALTHSVSYPLVNLPDTSPWNAAQSILGSDGRLSILMPAYNLGRQIAANIRTVHDTFSGHIPFEIVPINDGSTDDTATEIQRVATELSTVRPVLLAKNVGKGEALKQGLQNAKGNYTLLIDGDLDLSPELVVSFFDIMRREKADIVIGSKMHPESVIDYPLKRRIASRVYYTIVKILIGLPVRDTQTGLKLYKTEALRHAFERMLCKRFAFDIEVLAIAHSEGYKIAEAPITMSFGDKAGSLTAKNTYQTMNDTLAVFYRLKILNYYKASWLPDIDPLPSVTAVIACPGPSDYLTACIQGLFEQNYPNLEILVLPNEPVVQSFSRSVEKIPKSYSVALMTITRKSGRRPLCTSRTSAIAKSAWMLRSWNSSKTTSPTSLNSGSP